MIFVLLVTTVAWAHPWAGAPRPQVGTKRHAKLERYAKRVAPYVDSHPEHVETHYRRISELDRQGQEERDNSITYNKLVRGDPAIRDVALTFDDGPHPEYTPQLLAILAREHVPATFFVIGKMVMPHPELVRDELEAGHEVANHTFSHLLLPRLPDTKMIEKELVTGSEAIKDADPKVAAPLFYRPPGGEYDQAVIDVAEKHHYTMVLWTDDPGDYSNPGAGFIERDVLRDVSNGAIILLHDGVQETIDVLPQIISKLKERGYRFVTVSEMAKQPGAIRIGGPNTYPGWEFAPRTAMATPKR
jgi:peptidoglycan/xylan/chitin deacetylase (PgdA/CDA1 family)